ILVLTALMNLLLSIFSKSNFIGYWNFTFFPQYAGIGLELLFFSLGLGYKTRMLETEKNKVMQTLENEKREKAHQKELNRVRSTFFTNITHEFRTPLTVIMGLSEELKENKKIAIHKKANAIYKNGAKLLDLVNHLLGLSKLQSGHMQTEYKRADIISFLKYQVNAFRSLSDSKHISLVCYSEMEELVMDFDAEKMEMIISNLLSNAIRFTQEYGEILMIVRLDNRKNKSLEIVVRDNGEGINAIDLPNVFDRFYQGENSAGKGTGIGLALVKELIELMDGTIEVISQPEKGTEFTIRLPIRQSSVQEVVEVVKNVEKLKEIAPQHEGVKHSKAEKNPEDLPMVLLVEDNPDVRFFIKSCLDMDYRIIEADNGEVGLQMAIEYVPDLLISDVMMPKKDGFELCRELKDNEQTDHIPIILLTAKATQQDKNTGLSYGADAYLIKPFDKKELLIRVEKLIEIRKKLEARFRDAASHEEAQSGAVLRKNAFLSSIDEILEKNYADDSFSTQALCRCMGISKTRLYEQVKKESGLSVGLYIRAFRLRKAKELLMKNNKISVKEVAYGVGFTSPVYFSQQFKKAFGCSPGRCRSGKEN
ncbi:MAG TPA: response regulator, partial [Phaeodactylibacter sp.]|nr:response regulator [Phaeodactylibacter sp.]